MQNSVTGQPREFHLAVHPSAIPTFSLSFVSPVMPHPRWKDNQPCILDHEDHELWANNPAALWDQSKPPWAAQMMFGGTACCPCTSAVLSSQGQRPGRVGRGPCQCSRTQHHGDTQGATSAPGCALTSVRQHHPTCYSCSCDFGWLLALPQQPQKWFFPQMAPRDLLAKWMLLQQHIHFPQGTETCVTWGSTAGKQMPAPADKPAGMGAKQAQLWHKVCSGIATVVNAQVAHEQPWSFSPKSQ